MSSESMSTRFRIPIVSIIITMHIHVSTPVMVKQPLEPFADVRVDLDFCYNVRYYTHFLGEINCSSDSTVYNSQIHGQIHYSSEQLWQFQEKPVVCMCSCNFNPTELRNGYVIGNSLVSHMSYLNYTCHPGFTKTTSSRLLCLDGIFVSFDNIELPDLKEETSAIFRKNPMSNKDFNKLSNCVYKFVIDSDSWIFKDYPPQKGFAYQVYNGKVPYKLQSKQGETFYKDGYIDISSRREISCIKDVTIPLIRMDSVSQNITHIFSVPAVGCLIVIFLTVGIVLFFLARRKVSMALQKQSSRECYPLFSSIRQETASTSSGEFGLVTASDKSRSKFSTRLTGSGELYSTENKHFFYSRSGKCRLACQLTPMVLRNNLSSGDNFGTIHSKYREDNHDIDEHLPENSERPQSSNMTENIYSWSSHILKRSKSESDVSEKDLRSRNLHIRSHSDSRIVHFGSIMSIFKDGSASASTMLKENIAKVINEDPLEEFNELFERINQTLEVCMDVDVMNEHTKSDDGLKFDDDITLHREDNDDREITPLINETRDMKNGSSPVSMSNASFPQDGEETLLGNNGCSLDCKNSKSEMALSFLSSREMVSSSLRWKSDAYIFTPS